MDSITRERIVQLIDGAGQIVVLTGAGISTSAGIKDFRGPDGLYNLIRQRYDLPYPEAIFEIDFFLDNPEPFFHLTRSMLTMDAQPTRSHAFLAWLEEQGKMSLLVTQNIDMLHHRAGSRSVLECHGTMRTARCLECGAVFVLEELRAQILDGMVPRCTCDGLIKPDIVFFGEPLPAEFYTAYLSPPQADLVLILGTSLNVQPAAGFALSLTDRAPSILVNNEPTPHDARMTHVVHGDLDHFCRSVWQDLLDRT